MRKRRQRRHATVRVVMFNPTSGKRLEITCRRWEELPDRFLLTKSEGWGISSANQFMKKDWTLTPVEGPSKKGRKRKIAHDPDPEPVKTPDPVPMIEQPTEEPIVPKPNPEEDDEVFTAEQMALINDSKGAMGRESPGDLTKELPGEYNNNIKHDTIGAEDLAMMKAKVDSEFARQDGLRRIAQAKAKRQLVARVEQSGVGILPDGTF